MFIVIVSRSHQSSWWYNRDGILLKEMRLRRCGYDCVTCGQLVACCCEDDWRINGDDSGLAMTEFARLHKHLKTRLILITGNLTTRLPSIKIGDDSGWEEKGTVLGIRKDIPCLSYALCITMSLMYH